MAAEPVSGPLGGIPRHQALSLQERAGKRLPVGLVPERLDIGDGLAGDLVDFTAIAAVGGHQSSRRVRPQATVAVDGKQPGDADRVSEYGDRFPVHLPVATGYEQHNDGEHYSAEHALSPH